MIDLRNYVVLGLGASLALALVWGGTQTVRLSGETAEHSKTKANHAQQLQRISDATTKAVQAAQVAQQATQRAVAAIDTQRTQELTHALFDNDRRRATPGGLRIRVSCPARPAATTDLPRTTPAPSVDAQAAEIPAAFRQELWDLRAALIEERAQILALQDYARTCSPP